MINKHFFKLIIKVHCSFVNGDFNPILIVLNIITDFLHNVIQIKNQTFIILAEACNEWRDPSSRLNATATRFARNSSDGPVVRSSASGGVDFGLIPSWVKPMTLKLVIAASLLDAQHQRDSVENKEASLLVMPLGKALSGIVSPWCGRQMAGNS